jgi:DNA-binding transcriptional MocR family regulator
VIVTPGSLVALNLLLAALVAQGDRAMVEAPTYDRMLRTLRVAGADVVTVPHGDDGLDVDALAERLDAGVRPVLLYLLPTFHNPTGRTLPRRARERLADLAVERELMVIEDDPYGLLRVQGEPEPELRALLARRGGEELSVFMSSFSKTVSPGLRVGYAVAPQGLAARLATLAVDLYVSPPVLAQAQLFEFLDAGFLEPHLEDVRAQLRRRRDALLAVLEARLAGAARWTRPDGGYFLWLELAAGLDAATLLRRARDAGVAFVPGTGFFAGPGGEHAARLSFSHPSPAEVHEAAERLAALIAPTPVSGTPR